MASLSGQTIQSTYPGLLKLETATTGITSSLQAIQDGLGNNTGLRISTTQLEAQNIPSFSPLKPRYFGSGFLNVTGVQFGAGTQNTIISSPFYDGGIYEYSAITINIVTQTSTSDTLEFAIYTSQIINPNGLFPHIPIVSGLTADTTTTGLKTITLPSNISMSGYGGGLYWFVFKISNSGVQPTVRTGANATIQNIQTPLYLTYGPVLGFTSNTYQGNQRMNNVGNSFQHFSGLSTFDNPYSNTINASQNTATNVAGNGAGFLLHTVGG
jgi:hypothetical protein